MYDGYYIYGEYYNDTKSDYQYGLKPFIYYSCRYKKGNNDFVVNYTLDNTITIYGMVNGQDVTKSGALINPNSVTNIKEVNGEVVSLQYNGVLIEREILKEQLITLETTSTGNTVPLKQEYEYIIYNNRKIYKDGTRYFWNNKNQKQYISDKETLDYINSMIAGGHLYSNSAVKYYAEAKKFSDWVNSKLGSITQEDAVDSDGNIIQDFNVNTGKEEIFKLSEKNDPTKNGSTFQENRMSVIRKSIITNLTTAIANFNTSAHTYEFVMPIFEEEDWDKLVNNVAVASFMQGIPIGGKYYNNYCIIANNKNEEFTPSSSIYVITEDGQAHLATCKYLIENGKKVVGAYKNIDFERQTVMITEEDENYFYPHANERCYYCMVNMTEPYELEDIIQGQLRQYNKNTNQYEANTNATNKMNSINLRKIYLTALAREKYDLYKTSAYFGI